MLTTVEDEERVRYDRQIRLWGKSTQQRLTQTDLHFHSVRGALAEVAKNLVLAGVRAATLMGATPITADDVKSNFLVQHGLDVQLQQQDQERQAAATLEEVCAMALGRLNPHVRTTASPSGAADTTAATVVVLAAAGRLRDVETALSAAQAAQSHLTVVVTASTGGAGGGQSVLALFFYGAKDEKGDPQSQSRPAVLTDPAFLTHRPAAYQAAALALHLANGTEAQSFSARVAAATRLVQELQLNELTGDDVEEIASATPVPSSASTSVPLATQAGACIAQQIVSIVGGGSASGAARVRWMLCRADPRMETLIG